VIDPPHESQKELVPWTSRRNFVIASALGTIAAVVTEMFTGVANAEAAIVWGHPFTFYSSRSRGFTGQYSAGKHAGIDYTPGAGTPIHAVADGNIVYSVGDHPTYGQVVFVDHGGGYTSRYAHMQAGSRVSAGQFVTRGTYLGRVGNTGQSYGAHLHVEVLQGQTALDPDPLIDRNRTAPLAGTNTPEVDLQADERAALFEIRDKIELIRAALLNGRPEYYGGAYSAFDVVLSHASQAKDTSAQILAKVNTLS
jgi:hypothetical protein